MNRKSEIANRVIKNMIDDHQKNKKTIRLNVVQNRVNTELQKENETVYSVSSIRRIMVKNDLIPKKGAKGEYIYSPLKSLLEAPKIELLDINNYICYSISQSCYCPQIASCLNEEFRKKSFKAIALGDVLICLYKDKNRIEFDPDNDKNDSDYVDDSEIGEDDEYDVEEYEVEEFDDTIYEVKEDDDTVPLSEIKRTIDRLINQYKRFDY